MEKKYLFQKINATILISGILLITQGCSKSKCPCSAEVTGIVSNVYLKSLPLLGDPVATRELVGSHTDLFQPDGAGIKCLQKLGDVYLTNAAASFSTEERNQAYENVLSMGGSKEMADEAAASVNSEATNKFTVSQELHWLAKVLPEAANGNWEPFNNTGTQTRNAIKLMVPMLESMNISRAELIHMLQMDGRVQRAYEPFVRYELATMAVKTCD